MNREDDPFYSRENMARLRKSIAQLEAGGGTEHELIDADSSTQKLTEITQYGSKSRNDNL